MDRSKISTKEYTILPTHVLPSRASLTPRRLLIPALIATLGLVAVSSLHLTGRNVGSFLNRGGERENVGELLIETAGWNDVGKPLALDASLEERLIAWEAAPLGEPADWVTQSVKTCPAHRIMPNQNKQQLEQSHLLWSSMNSTFIGDLRDSMIHFLRKANKAGRMSKKAWGEGHGLVFTAGNADTFSRVLLTLKLLHDHLESPLPSEIFSFPGEAPDEETRLALEKYGAKLRIVQDAVRDGKRTKNYHIKATAIIKSKFRHVMYLDSDNMPTSGLGPLKTPQPFNSTVGPKWSDPSGLWESKAYKRLGVMFWPDYWRTSADNPIWSIIGVQCRDEWEQEAGQIIIDKALHLDALLLSEWMMDSTRFKFWFNFSDGDKDMFRYSFLALRKRWGVPGKYVTVGALPSNSMSGFCGHTMLQADHIGRPLFVHANLLKQIPSGVGKGFAWGKSRAMRSFSNTLKHEADEPKDEELDDYDVDCDMLANADHSGNAIAPAPPAVRKRAALEKGLVPFFHGGWISALCIDMRWDDPRTDDEIEAAKTAVSGKPTSADDDTVDVSFTSSEDGLEILWKDPLQVLEWKDDVRLKDFEEVFFAEGGHLNGKGF